MILTTIIPPEHVPVESEIYWRVKQFSARTVGPKLLSAATHLVLYGGSRPNAQRYPPKKLYLESLEAATRLCWPATHTIGLCGPQIDFWTQQSHGRKLEAASVDPK